ncbi:MAG: N-acetylmuramidase family protein [Prevotellaceae bacterium]|nr:N-acetylmuramidase family protein [Candidatus Minthosoma equi]
MKIIRYNSDCEEVKLLRSLLGMTENTLFDTETNDKVVAFQKAHGLDSDGIIGYRTWEALLFQGERPIRGITEDDFRKAALLLDCEPEALKAVQMVETGGKGGFLANDKPAILFEGHIFWKQLKTLGINPSSVVKGNEDIVYEKWTKVHYKGGVKEYDRLERARKINRDAADTSASWGMFQIMGFNHKACGEKTVSGFVEAMCRSEIDQLLLSARFINGNKVMLDALQKKNWATFAKAYNGPAYAQNQYDVKLANAYKKCLS